MNAARGSVHSRYEGLLPIEPPNIVFRPIDLNPEPIDLNREKVAIPNGQLSAWGLRFLILFCTGVAATFVWYGDTAREMITNSYQPVAPRPALTAQNPRPDVIGLAAPAAPSAGKLNAISFDFDAVGQNHKITATPTTASVDQAPAAKASGVIVEGQSDAASPQPTAPLNMQPTEAKPPEMLSEKGKPLAARPGGGDHRRERVARKETVGTTENRLAARLAPRPRGWSFGLP
jgi:hypothetical protein